MRWRELLFAHWLTDASVIAALLPRGLQLDLFEGRCYVGAVPFLMEGVAPRILPPVPGLHSFPELNLRTYVIAGRKPGVWFFSLDAGQKLAVRAARRLFHLPYFDGKFEIDVTDKEVRYSATRTHRSSPGAQFSASYRPVGPPDRARPGSFEQWLTARFCLYAADRGGILYRGEIDHEPWPLQRATAEITTNTLGNWLGIEMRGEAAHLLYAKSIDVKAWLLERV
jgi:uncharacterized protein YqjF (DUF2071 family)